MHADPMRQVEPDAPAEKGRWAQFSYASFDLGNGASGGWQVKEKSDDLTDAELEYLRSRVVTQFNADVALSDFPDARELELMPRRFSYLVGPDGTAGYWHSVMAGRDATGRPGNVFSHVLLDRRSFAAEPSTRPIELWRSPELVVPYGPEKVMQSVLPAGMHPQFTAGTARESALALLFDPQRWRLGLYCVLLDAVHGALRGGPGVVLVTDTPDSAAEWIGAVSALTSARLARQLNFSVYERGTDIGSALSAGMHLVCVPRADAPGIRPSAGFILLDENEAPRLGECDGDPHLTQAGSPVAATHWSELAQEAFVDRDAATAAMDQLDGISARLGDTGDALEWPLAMAAVCLPEMFPDSQSEAASVLLEHSPKTLDEHPDLLSRTYSMIVATSVGHAEAAWENLERISEPKALRDLLARHYLSKALTDGDWLRRPGPVPLPPAMGPDALSDELRGQARRAVLAIAPGLADDASAEALAAAHRLLDLALRTGLVRLEGDEEIHEAANGLFERILDALLDDAAQAEAYLQAAPAVASPALRALLLGVAAFSPHFHRRPVGARMPAAVCRWMGDPNVDLVPVGTSPKIPKSVPAVELEVLLWRVLHNGETGSAIRTLVLGELLDQGRAGEGAAAAVQAIAEPWTTGDLIYLEERYPCVLDRGHFRQNLRTEQRSPALERLATLLAGARDARTDPDGLVWAMAKLRLACTGGWPESTKAASAVLENARILLLDDPDALSLQEVASTVVLAALRDGIMAPHLTNWAAPRGPAATGYALAEPAAGDPLAMLVRRHVFDAAEPGLGHLCERLSKPGPEVLPLHGLAEAALSTAEGYPGEPVGRKALALSGAWVEDRFTGTGYRLLDLVYEWALVGRNPAPGDEGTGAFLKSALDAVGTGLGDRQAEKARNDLGKFATSWLRDRLGEEILPEPENSMKKVLGVFKNNARKER